MLISNTTVDRHEDAIVTGYTTCQDAILIAWPDLVCAVQIVEGKAYPYWEMHLYLHEAAFARAYDHFFGPQVNIYIWKVICD